jgi:UDPglucose 6-dehydrogenase
MIKLVTELSSKACGDDFGFCANPEFLREGTAVRDMRKPDRIIIGEYDKRSGYTLQKFYSCLYSGKLPTIIRTSLSNAELIKYVNNAFLASKVSFINSVANLCEKIPDTDVKVVARAIGLDQRIGSRFLDAGLGWGGSCFPKDVKAILSFVRDLGIDLPIVSAALQTNDKQPILAVEIADEALNGVKGRRIAILGLAFKPNTDDIREAVSLKLIDELRRRKAKICVYDPAANENAARVLGDSVTFAKSVHECVRGADCCIIATEWDEFRQLQPKDFTKMRRRLLIDGRRLYDPDEFSRSVEYYAVGLGPRIGKGRSA